jgi:hypothetical protein
MAEFSDGVDPDLTAFDMFTAAQSPAHLAIESDP